MKSLSTNEKKNGCAEIESAFDCFAMVKFNLFYWREIENKSRQSFQKKTKTKTKTKVNLAFIKNWFIAKIILISQKIFVLKLFKIVANQTERSKIEQRSVIKFLVAEKSQPCEIYGRTCGVCGVVCSSQKYLYK